MNDYRYPAICEIIQSALLTSRYYAMHLVPLRYYKIQKTLN